MSALERKGTVIVDYDTLDSHAQNLILEAIEARKLSYSPYSKFPVGACLECEDGTLYRGCNIENSLLSLSICAERTAMAKAISEGQKHFKTIAVIAYQEKEITTPCGLCRQYMVEFNKDIVVYATRPTLGQVLITTVDALLPYSFHL